MTALDGVETAATRLKQTCLRDFGPPLDPGDDDADGELWLLEVPAKDAPVPRLLKYALQLVGLQARGPGEKVEWWVHFTYRGHPCNIAHQKFGVRLRTRADLPEKTAEELQREIVKKLNSAARIVEKLVLDAAPTILGHGDALVINQHYPLLRAYNYFRDRALNPALIEDEKIVHHDDGKSLSYTFSSGKDKMKRNAFHDLVAAITAYLSLLEHDLVLALAFRNFDPATDNLTEVIGARWGSKFERVLGKDTEANSYRQKLTEVVERWRNPYSHGGFEKGHSATIYLATQEIGWGPVGVTSVRDSPHFSFIPASESDIAEVFALLDELDTWLHSELAEAMDWIKDALPVRFDAAFRSEVQKAIRDGRMAYLIEKYGYAYEKAQNMDYP